MRTLLSLLRVNHWYKNLLIFVPMLFGHQLFNTSALGRTLIGLLSLCLVSSANYILNDIADIERDRLHPEKRKKPIASGIVKPLPAFILAVVLLFGSFQLAYMLSIEFVYFVLALFLLTLAYTMRLKHEVFLDVIAISINFVLRAVSGAYVTSVSGKPYIWVSPWLLVCTFFLALLLASGKRYAELGLLKGKAESFRAVLKEYTPKTAEALFYISAASLIVSYTIYPVFLKFNQSLIFTAPIALYAVLRYIQLTETGSKIPLHPQTFYRDGRLLGGAAAWLASVIIFVYIL